MERFCVKHPIYPLLCLISTLGFLIAGLAMARRTDFYVFLIEICIFYIVFGYMRPLLAALAVFIPVSLVFALVTWLVNAELSLSKAAFGRVLLIGICAVPALGMPLIRLVRNLNQMHFPKLLTLGMLITVRFIPMVAAETAQIREAMKTRGVSASPWNIKCLYRALLIPLVMRLISISDTMALSLETRGFEIGDTPVSIYEPVRFEARDGIYLAAMAVLICGNLILL